MPEFRHTVVLCGPKRQLILQRTECPACSWHAEGNSPAIKIAENAHRSLHKTAADEQCRRHSRC